jgi:hypothetical protein
MSKVNICDVPSGVEKVLHEMVGDEAEPSLAPR